MLPSLDDLLRDAQVVALPMRVPFRGIRVRESMLLRGPYGWGEFAPFLEYGDSEAARWLSAAVSAGWQEPVAPQRLQIPINATIPAVAADVVADVLARFDGCRTVKVKVAHVGQSLTDDVARVAAARAMLGSSGAIRVDANAAWSVEDAVRALTALAPYGLEYAEQPCASVPELAELRVRLARARVDVPVAVDESIRRADDPLRIAVAGAADVVVLKVAPLGGVRLALRVAQECGLPVVVSSALDTTTGLAAGVALAAALPNLPYACGLGTAALFNRDVTTQPLLPQGGVLDVRSAQQSVVPQEEALALVRALPARRQWWFARLTRCYGLLAAATADQ
ncbi:MAG: o-succinylbenzoate synthase [Actinomycetota bacterium]